MSDLRGFTCPKCEKSARLVIEEVSPGEIRTQLSCTECDWFLQMTKGYGVAFGVMGLQLLRLSGVELLVKSANLLDAAVKDLIKTASEGAQR